MKSKGLNFEAAQIYKRIVERQRPAVVFSLFYGIVVILFIFATLIIVDSSILTNIPGLHSLNASAIYELPVVYVSPNNFTYDITAIEIKGGGATLIAGRDAVIELNTALKIAESIAIKGFKEISTKPDGTAILYQISTNFNNYYYFKDNGWIVSDDCM